MNELYVVVRLYVRREDNSITTYKMVCFEQQPGRNGRCALLVAEGVVGDGRPEQQLLTYEGYDRLLAAANQLAYAWEMAGYHLAPARTVAEAMAALADIRATLGEYVSEPSAPARSPTVLPVVTTRRRNLLL